MTGVEISPTEFERIGGRATTKKWKTSVRLLEADGQAGQTLGDWLQVQVSFLPLLLSAMACIRNIGLVRIFLSSFGMLQPCEWYISLHEAHWLNWSLQPILVAKALLHQSRARSLGPSSNQMTCGLVSDKSEPRCWQLSCTWA